MKYAIVDKATKVVSYLLDTVPLISDTGMHSAEVNATDIRSETHNAIEVSDVPEVFVGGVYTLIDGEWAVINQDVVDVATEVMFNQFADKYEVAVQAYLDSEAVAARFDNMDRACYYAMRPTSRWYAEALTFADWRDAVWAYCEDFYMAVMAKTQQIPESIEAFIGSLPVRKI